MRASTGHYSIAFLLFAILQSTDGRGQAPPHSASEPPQQAQAVPSERPILGVVWDPPTTFSEIREELGTMAEHGVGAVRINLVFDENLHVLADLFDILVFQEIDLVFHAARPMDEQIGRYTQQIDSAVTAARRTGRPVYLGLGSWNDTTEDTMCETIQNLALSAKRSSRRIVTYYVSPFVEDDRCADVVDFVLLDTGPSGDPVAMVDRWWSGQGRAVGLAGLRAPVFEGADEGYRERGSEEAQARYLESMLDRLTVNPRVVAVFVDRWRETRSSRLRTIRIDGDPGIVAPDGSSRPAAEVVRGFFTRNQTVFAYTAGDADGEDFSWLNLFAFVTLALLGVAYYSSMSLRQLARRYFKSHSFYLEKVADGRDTLSGISLFLLFCLSVAASIVGLALVTRLQTTNLWPLLNHWIPDQLAVALRAGVRYPGVLVPAFAALFALMALLWAVTLSLLTRGSKRLSLGQTLLLTVMPRWPVAIVGLMALVLINSNLDLPLVNIVAISSVWTVVVFIYSGRVISDYLRILGFSALLTIPVLVLAGILGAATVWLIVATSDLTPELTFLWHLATRT